MWSAHGVATEHLVAMATAIDHRGPDHLGVWRHETSGPGLAHARLAVIDLSAAGQQPMVSASGRYAMVLNGEIYNHQAMREELETRNGRRAWRGHSDTETLLAGFDVWGVLATITRAVGMFAIAVWDEGDHELILVRDRLGEKPLYYGRHGDTFLFGSELKALRAHPAFHSEIDPDAVASYLRFGYVPGPFSIYRGIRKLPAATVLRVRDSGAVIGNPEPYWSLVDVARRGLAEPFGGTDQEAISALEETLGRAVSSQQMSDVPIGAFLSGGVDSSTVVALMQSQSARPIHTFTIGFPVGGYDESPHASEVARHLGTNHTTLEVTADDALAVVPRLPMMFDEPFGDSSQIPTSLVSALARRHVTVCLSGDAGDELFGGYNRYSRHNVLRRFRGLSGPLARSMRLLTPAQWDRMYAALAWMPGSRFRSSSPGDHVFKLASILELGDDASVYQHLVSIWPESDQPVPCGVVRPDLRAAWSTLSPEFDAADRMMVLDTLTYLADDILCKVDRAAMSVSLETRVPFLDHRVVELAWRMPRRFKIRNGEGKWLVRQVLDRHVPRRLIERPKQGFAVPIDTWLRGPLRAWAEELLSPARLSSAGFAATVVRTRWAEHLSGQRNWHHQLWSVLMLQAWLETYN